MRAGYFCRAFIAGRVIIFPAAGNSSVLDPENSLKNKERKTKAERLTARGFRPFYYANT